MSNDVIQTHMFGTFSEEFEVGKVYNKKIHSYGEEVNCTFRVLREVTEEEYRKRYDYLGELPIDFPQMRTAKFYEVLPLD